MLLDSDAADGLDVMGLPGTGMFSTVSISGFFLLQKSAGIQSCHAWS